MELIFLFKGVEFLNSDVILGKEVFFSSLDQLVLRGEKNSKLETYANQNNIKFEEIGNFEKDN